MAQRKRERAKAAVRSVGKAGKRVGAKARAAGSTVGTKVGTTARSAVARARGRGGKPELRTPGSETRDARWALDAQSLRVAHASYAAGLAVQGELMGPLAAAAKGMGVDLAHATRRMGALADQAAKDAEKAYAAALRAREAKRTEVAG